MNITILAHSPAHRSFDTVVECQKGYIKKCATPLQKELFDFFLESFTKTVEEFCGNPDTKQSKCFFSCLFVCLFVIIIFFLKSKKQKKEN